MTVIFHSFNSVYLFVIFKALTTSRELILAQAELQNYYSLIYSTVEQDMQRKVINDTVVAVTSIVAVAHTSACYK